MSKYRVYLVSVASTSVEVEAESGDEAVEVALSGAVDLPYASAFAGFDLGEWSVNSELFNGDPEWDWEEAADD